MSGNHATSKEVVDSGPEYYPYHRRRHGRGDAPRTLPRILENQRYIFRVYEQPKDKDFDEVFPFGFLASPSETLPTKRPVDAILGSWKGGVWNKLPSTNSDLYDGVFRHVNKWDFHGSGEPSTWFVSTTSSFCWALWEATCRLNTSIRRKTRFNVGIAIIDTTFLNDRKNAVPQGSDGDDLSTFYPYGAVVASGVLSARGSSDQSSRDWKKVKGRSRWSSEILIVGQIPRQSIVAHFLVNTASIPKVLRPTPTRDKKKYRQQKQKTRKEWSLNKGLEKIDRVAAGLAAMINKVVRSSPYKLDTTELAWAMAASEIGGHSYDVCRELRRRARLAIDRLQVPVSATAIGPGPQTLYDEGTEQLESIEQTIEELMNDPNKKNYLMERLLKELKTTIGSNARVG